MQLCTFQVGEFRFGLDVARVQEVVRFQPLTRVPLAAAEVRGLINLRGQIITTLDLRRRLDLPARTEATPPLNVLVNGADGVVSLEVDAISDVLEVDPASVEAPPEMLPASVRVCLRGVCKLSDRLLLLLDESATAHAV
jgi:purine-binding chemotaxis protein CheW